MGEALANMETPDAVRLIKSLPQGAQIETVVPFKGLAPKEKLTFKMVQRNDEKGLFVFDVLLLGIKLGTIAAKEQPDESLKWSRVQ